MSNMTSYEDENLDRDEMIGRLILVIIGVLIVGVIIYFAYFTDAGDPPDRFDGPPSAAFTAGYEAGSAITLYQTCEGLADLNGYPLQGAGMSEQAIEDRADFIGGCHSVAPAA
jgi:hypothetical protein